ncbi:MAG: putative multidrug resistance protein [Candidatus Hydrogenedentota bacterium]
MAWIYLLIAAAFEVTWAVALKYSEGFTRGWPTLVSWVTMVLSFVFLAQAVKTLPVGTAYAVWTGIGVVGTTLFGMWFFEESRAVWRIACIVLIVAGVVGLKLHTTS